MKLNEFVGSAFEAFPEPTEAYREGCFSFQKWIFESDSQDIKWIVLRREFLTLNEQAMEWIDKFNLPESTKLDAKRLIWDIRYDDYKTYRFVSPITIALCALKIACDLKNIDFFSSYNGCMEVIKINYTRGNRRILLHGNLSDSSTKEKIRYKSEQLLELIGPERIERLKKMWGCIDEAVLFGGS
jgi:hypothetical protein